jgi:hypothetical protein
VADQKKPIVCPVCEGAGTITDYKAGYRFLATRGAEARSKALSPERRREIAETASKAAADAAAARRAAR